MRDRLSGPGSKILHIMENEKHIDSIIGQFESCFPGQNIFLINASKTNPLRFIRAVDKVVVETYGSDEYRSYLDNMEHYRLVVFHNIHNPYKHDIILAAPGNALLCGSLWGNELYSFSFLRKSIYLPRTLRLMKYEMLLFYPKYLFKNLFLKGQIERKESKKRNVFRRLNIICGIIPSEITFFREISGSRARGEVLSPYTLEYLLGNNLEEAGKISSTGRNILFGNSANFSNNHLDLLADLAKIRFKVPKDLKVYCPLNYGSGTVRKHVMREGRKRFKDQFIPITEFMPLEQYRDIIVDSSILIMNHRKQAAFGTILIGLWMGAKVFLNEKNPLFPFFRENGITVFSVGRDLAGIGSITEPLPANSVRETRKNLVRLFGRESVFTQITHLVGMADTMQRSDLKS